MLQCVSIVPVLLCKQRRVKRVLALSLSWNRPPPQLWTRLQKRKSHESRLFYHLKYYHI